MLATVIGSCTHTTRNELPNVVFILIDDMGWKDLGCYGSVFYETPEIDALAEGGIRFTNAYSASGVCSPTRASILTGKSPARLHLTQWIGPNEWQVDGPMRTPAFEQQLALEEVTLAEVLKNSGYATFFAGKWHLGGPEFYPEHQGFDINIGGNDAGAPPSYFYPYERDNWKGTGWPEKIHSIKGGKPGEYLTDRLTDEALRFLDTVGSRPFLLYLSHYAIHKPLQAKQQDSVYFARKAIVSPGQGKRFIQDSRGGFTRQFQDHAVNAGMIRSVDQGVGRILAKLKSLDIWDNTIIVFTTDNGGVSCATVLGEGGYVNKSNICTSALPLRGGKGWYYEGGIRVPLIVKPAGGNFQPGTSDAPVISYDFLPTLVDMLDLESAIFPPEGSFERKIDGISFRAALSGGRIPQRPIFWHYPHYHTLGQTPASAIRMGKYKLIWWYEEEKAELYDLSTDLSETANLAEQLPDKTAELKEILMVYLASVNASHPSQNISSE